MEIKRSQCNIIGRKDDLLIKILYFQTAQSRAVYNSGIYFQRQYYIIRMLVIKHILDNIKKYVNRLSHNDIVVLFKYALFNKYDFSIIKKLYNLSYIEDNLISLVAYDKKIHDKLSKIKIEDSNSLSICQTFEDTLQTLTLIKDDIKSECKNSEFFDQLIETLNKRINKLGTGNNKNAKKKPKKNKEKDKKKANDQKDSKKVKKEPKVTIKNIIPPTYYNHMSNLSYTYVQLYIDNYKFLYSQVANQTLKKVDEAFLSFFEKKKVDPKTNLPNYLSKEDKYNLIFQGNSFSVKEYIDDNNNVNNTINLSLGLQFFNKFNEEHKFEPKKNRFMYKNKEYNIRHITIDVRNMLVDRNISKIDEIEISPFHNSYKIIYKYSKKIDVDTKSATDIKSMASIDFGMTNILALYSAGLKNPIIYNGRQLLHLNIFYRKRIAKLQSEVKKKNGKHMSKAIKDLWKNRELQINDIFNKLTNEIIKICLDNKISELVLGYNVNWKNNVNLGKKTNDAFYKIPYKRLISKLFDKGQEKGILVRENEEAYTSKCDALSFEEVKFHDKYLGERKKRGLFQSSTKHLINADVNGAINILRKSIGNNKKMTEQLIEEVNNNMGGICNPKKYPLNASATGQERSMTSRFKR